MAKTGSVIKTPTTSLTSRKQATLASFFGNNNTKTKTSNIKSPKSENSHTQTPPPAPAALHEHEHELVDTDDEHGHERKSIVRKLSPGTENKENVLMSDEDSEYDNEDVEDELVKDDKKRKPDSDSNAIPKQKKSKASICAIMNDVDKLRSKAREEYNWTVEVEPSVNLKGAVEVPYGAVTSAFVKCESITSRLAIQDVVTDLLRCALVLCKDDKKAGQMEDQVVSVVYLCCNSVAPAYKCVELGIGESLLIKAIGEASGTRPQLIKEKLNSVGDLGEVASLYRGRQKTLNTFKLSKPKPLRAIEVLQVFREIANTSGAKSQKWKVDKIKGLLVRCQTGEEAKYIIRALSGKLRIGLAESTVLVSLAHALIKSPPTNVTSTPDSEIDKERTGFTKVLADADEKTPLETKLEAAVCLVKKAYSEYPSYDGLVRSALKYPLYELHKHCTLTPGMPVAPMLAKPTKSVREVLKRLSGKRFTAEYKYDGERAQIHRLHNGESRVFSRNLLDTSEKYPEAPQYVLEAAADDVSSFVMDAEVVAFNRENGQLVPFQILSTRKKTADASETSDNTPKVKVIVQAFDLMYLNGESLLNKSLSERRDLLRKHFKVVEGKFQFATSLDHTEDGDSSLIECFLDAAVKGQCEGLMIKTLDDDADYEPSRRSLNWLKLKKDYLEGLGDSVDLVPLGAYFGKGKRTGVYGAYLLACYDLDTEEFQSVCKIGTGFSDEDLKTLAEGLNEHKISNKSSQYNVSDQLACDVWFDAVQVWEIKAADLSKSSAHRGAIDKTGQSGRGIGLRFPRFERLRDDKNPEDATTSDQILEMYYAQDTVNGGGMDETGGDGGI